MSDDELNPVIHTPARLRKLEDAEYVTTNKNGSGVTARTAVAITQEGRSALREYSTVLRELLDSAGMSQNENLPA